MLTIALFLVSVPFALSRTSLRGGIPSFKVMDVLGRALQLEAEGRNIMHMEVGQPSTKAPKKVLQAAEEALHGNLLGYTDSLGIPPLRESIASHYKHKYGVTVDSSRVIVTTGSSSAFMFAFLGLFDAADRVGLCGTGYPCYRNLMSATNLEYVSIPVNDDYKVTAKELQDAIDRGKELGEAPLKGLIMSSPGNPTGAMLTPEELKDLCETCEKNDITFISDEIYHGISYGKPEQTSLKYSDSSIVINSFSKYFSMTGWRLGWMVVPESTVDAMNRLSQNMAISAPTLSQLAAVSAFGDEARAELEEHVHKYQQNRQIVLDGLAVSNGLHYSHSHFLRYFLILILCLLFRHCSILLMSYSISYISHH